MLQGLNHITITVSDLVNSIGFYTDTLNMQLKAQWQSGAYLECGGVWLCLALGEAKPAQDYSHIAFTVNEQDMPKIKQTLTENNTPLWQTNRSEGESIYCLDPDGHKLELHIGDLHSRLSSLQKSPYKGLVIYD